MGQILIYLTGKTRIEEMSGLIRNYPALGWLFFVTTLSLAGIPPLSGFLGKLYVGQGAIEAGSYILLGLAFLSGMFVLYSMLRIFMNTFWGETIISEDEEKPLTFGLLMPCIMLGIVTIVLGLGAEYILVYVEDAAYTLMNPSVYVEAILGTGN